MSVNVLLVTNKT